MKRLILAAFWGSLACASPGLAQQNYSDIQQPSDPTSAAAAQNMDGVGAGGYVDAAQAGAQTFRPDDSLGSQSDAARWRYKWHNGSWWYWTRNNSWMVWRGSQWIRYEDLAATSASPTYVENNYYPSTSSGSYGYGYYPRLGVGYPAWRYGYRYPGRYGWYRGYPWRSGYAYNRPGYGYRRSNYGNIGGGGYRQYSGYRGGMGGGGRGGFGGGRGGRR